MPVWFRTRAWCWLVSLCGPAGGLQDSPVKALVANLVPSTNRGTAYGVLATCPRVAALAGGTQSGGHYTDHLALLATALRAARAVA